MLVKDSITTNRHLDIIAVEQYADKIKSWVEEQTKNEQFTANWETSPLNSERQTGRMMTPEELEKLLRPYLPSSCFFRLHPTNPTKRYIGQFVNGEEVTVVVYENASMPEHSYRAAWTEEVWDKSVTHLDRKDISPSVPNPGMYTSVQPGREIFRGWRTVIIRLVEEGFLTPGQAESLFGAAQREEWAFHMGRRKTKKVPW